MTRERYDDYIRRFNAQDMTAFEEFLAPHMHMKNGTLEYSGIQGMKDHYARIWKTFSETLYIERFVCDKDTLAVQMWAHFEALEDDPASTFGPVQKGETFDYRGVIMYRLEGGKFSDICVAYNSFIRTDLAGRQTDLGIPH